jgi:hypothetical protein
MRPGPLPFLALLATSACGQLGTVNPVIIDGDRFAHSIQFPSRFRAPKNPKGNLPLVFDHYAFRLSHASPSVLLVAACKELSLTLQVLEVCSLNSFAINTEHGYGTRVAEAGEWEQGEPIQSLEMNDPTSRTIKQEYAKPAFLRAIPIAPGEGQEFQGYKYRGKEYRRRGDWIGVLTFGSSEDGSLVVLAGADKRKRPDPRPAYVAAAIYTIPWGLVTIDVYAADPSHHIAALDLDCHTTVDSARRRISLVGSRWLAIGEETFLQKMLLLDFKPAGEKTR